MKNVLIRQDNRCCNRKRGNNSKKGLRLEFNGLIFEQFGHNGGGNRGILYIYIYISIY